VLVKDHLQPNQDEPDMGLRLQLDWPAIRHGHFPTVWRVHAPTNGCRFDDGCIISLSCDKLTVVEVVAPAKLAECRVPGARFRDSNYPFKGEKEWSGTILTSQRHCFKCIEDWYGSGKGRICTFKNRGAACITV